MSLAPNLSSLRSSDSFHYLLVFRSFASCHNSNRAPQTSSPTFSSSSLPIHLGLPSSAGDFSLNYSVYHNDGLLSTNPTLMDKMLKKLACKQSFTCDRKTRRKRCRCCYSRSPFFPLYSEQTVSPMHSSPQILLVMVLSLPLVMLEFQFFEEREFVNAF